MNKPKRPAPPVAFQPYANRALQAKNNDALIVRSFPVAPKAGTGVQRNLASVAPSAHWTQAASVHQPSSKPVAQPRADRQVAPPLSMQKQLSLQKKTIIQRAQERTGLPGFFTGSLSDEQRQGTFNTVWSQTSPLGSAGGTTSHSSAKNTKRSHDHLVNFAQITHLEDEENTHAEDKLFGIVHQHVALVQATNAPCPSIIVIPNFYVSASPCTSVGGTSAKTTGCTENLIAWATSGMDISEDSTCPINVKVKIKKLTVGLLYKSNSREGAMASYAALLRLKESGAIASYHIEKMPRLTDFKGNQDG